MAKTSLLGQLVTYKNSKTDNIYLPIELRGNDNLLKILDSYKKNLYHLYT